MKTLFDKLNIYDQFGYIMVGIHFILFANLLFLLKSSNSFLEVFNQNLSLINSFNIIIISYFLGHIIQSISNMITKENKNINFENEEIIQKARIFFKLESNAKNSRVFNYCYLYSLSNDFSGQILLFNSLHSFYRGLFVSCVLNIVAFVVILSITLLKCNYYLLNNYVFWITLIIIIVQAFLFWNRRIRFYKYLNEKVFITFDILTKNILKD